VTGTAAASHGISDYGVIGCPVTHSKSPCIHRWFAEQCGQRIRYRALPAPADGFAEAVRHFQRDGGRGLNVTLPFKREAYAIAHAHSTRARQAGAVNTLCFRDEGAIFGDNTDGVGLLHDLQRNLGVTLDGRRILLLGAGGAARGILGPLLQARPVHVAIFNRTRRRALALAADFAGSAPLQVPEAAALHELRFEVVINATSLGLHGGLPDLPDRLLAPGATDFR